MKIRALFLGSAVLMVTACATAPTVPVKRPMTADAKAQIGSPDINVRANNLGIGASWFQTQSNGGGTGLAGAIGAAIADAIINAAPSSRAKKIANEVAENVVAEDLNASFMEALTAAQLNGAQMKGSGEISLKTVSMVNSLDKSLDHDGKVFLSVSYMLAEDASAFKAVASAEYINDDIPYVTPYSFEKNVPKSQMGGPLYSNSFTFNSSQFEAPVLTEELKVELVKAVEDSFRGEDGTLPTEGSDFKKMQKSLEKAQDDKLTKSETSVFLVQSWLVDGAAPLKAEINEAHAFFAKYLVTDLSSTAVPSLTGIDSLLETRDDGRIVKLIGQGNLAGSYASEPGNLTSFTTYGNAVNYSSVGRDTVKDSKESLK